MWVDHLRHGNERLADLLRHEQVAVHPFILGELALEGLKNRTETLELLRQLPQSESASHDEALAFIDRHRIAGSGIGWVDVHLLVSAALESSVLWTLDRRLGLTARRLGLAS